METTQVTMTAIDMRWFLWIAYFVAAALGALASSLVVNKGSLLWPRWKSVPDNTATPQEATKKKGTGDASAPTEGQSTLKEQLYGKARDLGFTGDIFVGLAAAMAVLWAMTPQTLFQLVGIGAVAGYGGSTILQSLVSRIGVDISMTEKEKLEIEKLKLGLEKEVLELEKAKAEAAEKQKKLDSLSQEKFVIEKLLEYEGKEGQK